MRTSHGLLAIVVLTLSGCGSEAAAGAAPPTAPPAAGATPPAPATAAQAAPAVGTAPTPAPAADAVPLRERPLPERIAATTVTVPAPAPQTEGTFTLTAQACTLDGPPFLGDDSFTTIGPIAWSTDGSLYLADSEGQIRRYTAQPGAACALTMDTTFGTGGRLAVGEGLGARVASMASDAHGHVYVATSQRGTTRITGTHVDYNCETRGELSVAPDGSVGIAMFAGRSPQLVTFTDAGCTTAAWEAAELPENLDSITFLDDERILVGGHAGTRAPHLARVYDRNGRPQGAAFGDTTDDLNADDHFCHVHGAVLCSAGICVHDGNCRRMRVFDAQHAVSANVQISRAIGVEYPWVAGITVVRDGVAYATANQQRGRASERTNVYDGFVFRLTGL